MPECTTKVESRRSSQPRRTGPDLDGGIEIEQGTPVLRRQLLGSAHQGLRDAATAKVRIDQQFLDFSRAIVAASKFSGRIVISPTTAAPSL